MKCLRWLGPCLALLILVPLVSAQEKSPLAQVPGDAPIVLHLRGFERTKGRLITLINNALPDLGKRVQESIEDTLKGELGERQLKGLAPFGPVFLVFTAMPQAGTDWTPPSVVLRVTDAKAFREGFFTAAERKTLAKDPAGYETLKFRDDTLYLIDRDGWIIFAPAKDAVTPFLKVDRGLDTRLGAEAAKKMLDVDASAWVDTGAVHKVYGQTVRDFRQFIDLGLQQAGPADKESVEMMKSFIDGALQGFEDSRGLLLTADFRPDGAALHVRVKFAGDSKTNQVLKTLTPTDLGDVDTLPAGQMSYVGIHTEPALNKAFAALLSGVLPDPASKQGQAMQKALDLIDAAGPQASLQTASLTAQGLTVSRYKDPAQATQGQLQLFQALTASESYNRMKLKKAAVTPEAQKHRGFTLHLADLVWDYEKMLADTPFGGKEFVDSMKKMMGEGMKVWFGTDGKVMIQLTGKDWASAQQQLDTFLDGKDPVGKQAAIQEARKHLPDETTVLAYYDVPQFMESIRTMMAGMFKAAGQGEIKVEPAKDKPKPAFFGAAITLKAEHAALDLWLPAGMAREVQKLIDPLIQAFGG